MFLPTTKKELNQLGWDALDIILVSGDAYIDSPFIGTAVIGRVLTDAGFRVGIIAQPDLQGDDICRLGEPKLFWGVSGGCVDSMVANLTASGRKRKKDDYTPGGINNRRPDRAVLIYADLIRSKFKKTCPIVLGGIEASLRRIAHYDYWSNAVRRSILLDAKADFLLYGMAERAVVELASSLRDGTDPQSICGLCYQAS
ncbi:MAG: YgiQ family radical SAM protein, partial [Candidatus Electrothrix sp. AR1]|nr:YgiQ family radical SAM protein [Candidatus Electrothrix sp. AR1]